MKEITILMQSPEDPILRTRVGCRGIIIKEGRILLSCESKKNWYFIPGGGLEEGETLEEGCIREVEEETGVIVRVKEHVITVNCIYRGRNFQNHFFLCEEVGRAEQRLTNEEADNELVPVFLPVDEVLEMFSRYEELPEEQLAYAGCNHRDFEVLKYYLNR